VHFLPNLSDRPTFFDMFYRLLILFRGGLVLLIGALPVAGQTASPPRPEEVLLQEDFENPAEQLFAQRAIQHERIDYAPSGGVDGSAGIRVKYEGFDRGSQRVVVRYPLSSPVETATLSFDVLFEQDFQWVRGGKLHGLGPARPITGGKPRVPDGWSARATFKDDGHIATYLYDQNTTKKYGVGATSDAPVFSRDQWHHVTLQVQLNTPSKADGFSRVFVDGALAVHTKGVAFRGTSGPDTAITQILFSTFHGGSSPRYTPIDEHGKPTTVHARFDNFKVTAGLVGPPVLKFHRRVGKTAQ